MLMPLAHREQVGGLFWVDLDLIWEQVRQPEFQTHEIPAPDPGHALESLATMDHSDSQKDVFHTKLALVESSAAAAVCVTTAHVEWAPSGLMILQSSGRDLVWLPPGHSLL